MKTLYVENGWAILDSTYRCTCGESHFYSRCVKCDEYAEPCIYNAAVAAPYDKCECEVSE